eukprot:CAMPEP_0172638276 /NCGR_PEP_ID=MMETSP1068-20121228/213097_1 /TAXON_ID=35684 /ORGANISM="Pseudopedinella elastica, Strain CCMP716" /LENGTH=72 /DNA_ID=CAMNT_0013451143 /DNA_START=423 /DNA_END=641 /DNA_ORIENTATION=+
MGRAAKLVVRGVGRGGAPGPALEAAARCTVVLAHGRVAWPMRLSAYFVHYGPASYRGDGHPRAQHVGLEKRQ